MILVSGDGKLARALVDLSSDDIQITKLPKKVMDITDEYEVSEVIKRYMTQPDYPKYFVHTAALTKPMNINDRNPIMSLSTNIVGTANVAKICHKYGIKFIYISTDFVYNSKDKVNEESGLKPSNKYGWSKLGGECVTKLIPDSLILRCSLCDIPFRHKLAFDDVYRNSIIHKDVAKIILKVKDETGVINVGGKYQSVFDFVSNHQDVNKASGKNIAPSLSLNIEKLKELINE
jgi:dTDP-4-dehydrorhamnose reductase|tara:strand:- start:707 stop:1405 length:699 start_codon:yes stop_codon:yes gene_type:complete